MPFCIYQQLGYATTPVAVAMAFLLLGIDEIGVQLEEPFSIMALEVSDSVCCWFHTRVVAINVFFPCY